MTTPPMAADTEITGPSALTLYVSSTTATPISSWCCGCSTPDGDEVVFQGAVDPHTPIGQGWLRASHRELDPDAVAPRGGRITPTPTPSR